MVNITMGVYDKDTNELQDYGDYKSKRRMKNRLFQ